MLARNEDLIGRTVFLLNIVLKSGLLNQLSSANFEPQNVDMLGPWQMLLQLVQKLYNLRLKSQEITFRP